MVLSVQGRLARFLKHIALMFRTESDVALDVVRLLLSLWVVPGSILQLGLCRLNQSILSSGKYAMGNYTIGDNVVVRCLSLLSC